MAAFIGLRAGYVTRVIRSGTHLETYYIGTKVAMTVRNTNTGRIAKAALGRCKSSQEKEEVGASRLNM
jgi:hypothetical protein